MRSFVNVRVHKFSPFFQSRPLSYPQLALLAQNTTASKASTGIEKKALDNPHLRESLGLVMVHSVVEHNLGYTLYTMENLKVPYKELTRVLRIASIILKSPFINDMINRTMMMIIFMVINTLLVVLALFLVQFIYVLVIIIVNGVISDHPYKGSVGSPQDSHKGT